MVVVPVGSFPYGSKNDDELAYSDEYMPPNGQNELISEIFAMGINPITNNLWKFYCNNHVFPDSKSEHPVVNVTWQDAINYCEWLNEIVRDHVYYLPSEREWEYSCLAGAKERYSTGDIILSSQANFNYLLSFDDKLIEVPTLKTTPAKKFRANRFGIFDMHGNVWEWTSDEYHGANTEKRHLGKRIAKGGSFNTEASGLRVSHRLGLPETTRDPEVGFRVARKVKKDL